ncbi:hypothetical protein Salat_1773100 [Sesamum alatum]|uniref:Uncharacterized protein n=1 Tax=Sesamum alatum TaxID=300844 RepID=A0AAE1Y9Q4_9LAMI|nr:hypothetical protein Salat_1773100 [Sesamum alatum]
MYIFIIQHFSYILCSINCPISGVSDIVFSSSCRPDAEPQGCLTFDVSAISLAEGNNIVSEQWMSLEPCPRTENKNAYTPYTGIVLSGSKGLSHPDRSESWSNPRHRSKYRQPPSFE